MFDLDFSHVVEACLPFGILLQVFREAFGQQNMTGIPARHDTLRDVNSSSCQIGLVVYIRDRIDGSAVNPHAQLQLRMCPQFSTDLYGTFHWRFRVVAEDEHHTVARR